MVEPLDILHRGTSVAVACRPEGEPACVNLLDCLCEAAGVYDLDLVPTALVLRACDEAWLSTYDDQWIDWREREAGIDEWVAWSFPRRLVDEISEAYRQARQAKRAA